MTDKEILKKILIKGHPYARAMEIIECDYGFRVDIYTNSLDYPNISLPYECIIFKPTFAKIYFGEGYNTCKNITSLSGITCHYFFHDADGSDIFSHLKKWEYCLQQMILEKKYIKYLEKFL